jgi:hypothetical protein
LVFNIVVLQAEQYSTGLGTSGVTVKNLGIITEKCLEIIKDQVTPLENRFDSSAEFIEVIEVELHQSSGSQSCIETVGSRSTSPGTSHQLRDPVGSVVTPMTLPEKSPLQPRKRPALRSVYDSINQVLQTKNDKVERISNNEEVLMQYKKEKHLLEVQLLKEKIENEKMKRAQEDELHALRIKRFQERFDE